MRLFLGYRLCEKYYYELTGVSLDLYEVLDGRVFRTPYNPQKAERPDHFTIVIDVSREHILNKEHIYVPTYRYVSTNVVYFEPLEASHALYHDAFLPHEWPFANKLKTTTGNDSDPVNKLWSSLGLSRSSPVVSSQEPLWRSFDYKDSISSICVYKIEINRELVTISLKHIDTWKCEKWNFESTGEVAFVVESEIYGLKAHLPKAEWEGFVRELRRKCAKDEMWKEEQRGLQAQSKELENVSKALHTSHSQVTAVFQQSED